MKGVCAGARYGGRVSGCGEKIFLKGLIEFQILIKVIARMVLGLADREKNTVHRSSRYRRVFCHLESSVQLFGREKDL